MHIKILDSILYSEEAESGFAPPRPGDAGIDLRAARSVRVVAGETAAIPLGVAVALPESTMALCMGRSSASTKRSLLMHAGIIDSGYRGEIHGMCTALGAPVDIQRGDRICQLIVVNIATPVWWEVVDELDETERGVAGLGSTGVS